ncbi:MAG: hypothetical protein A3A73_01960 [Omnitrophica bacterium RIFCSPLOWO2_01_FULL_50_24]|nr:MAG: hypothetical protein A3A73_01960 [Omnitrophica bacterium RIFCSPLOWO2_01_FULL_50_24]
MFKKFFKTEDDSSSFILRVMLGAVMFPHGAQLLFGWFGGRGFEATMTGFTTSMGLTPLVAFLVIMAESLGALSLILGFMTRLCAFGLGSVMTGAIVLVHWRYGFFMNWSGTQAGNGFEYHLLAIAIAVALVIKGGGRWSVDGQLV